MQEIKIGLIGFGTVGSGLAQVLYEQQTRLQKRVGASIRLIKVADIMVKSLPDHIAQGGKVLLTKDANDIFTDPEIAIVVELIGGIEPAKSFLLEAIERKKHVITANKALLASHGTELFRAAEEGGVQIGFEASCDGGSVVRPLRTRAQSPAARTVAATASGSDSWRFP